MNIEDVKQYLKSYNEHEEIYRQYYKFKNSPKELEGFLNQLDKSKIEQENILIPELTNVEAFNEFSDKIFFEDRPKRSIFMQKHNRYTPVFTHSHQFFELIYVYSGSAEHTLDGETNTIQRGDLCIVSPGTFHSLGVFDDSIILNALIKTKTFNDNFFEFLRDNNVLSTFFLNNLYAKQHINYITFHTKEDTELEHILFDMIIEHFNEDQLSDGILNNLLMIFFDKLLRKYKDSVEIPDNITKKNKKILEILNYIQANYQTVTLTDLSGYFHFAPPYISSLIKESTGQTYSSILQKIKLERAASLLLNTNLSIHDICGEIGYANPPHFIRLFSQCYHDSPSQYRKKVHLLELKK